MARIYDNIETKFAEGLQGIMTNVGVKRVDFCVGYFNLRGWNLVVDQIDTLTGDYVYENDKREFRKCRLLIGMHRPAEELIRQLYIGPSLPDANYVSQCKLEIARDFKRQLQLGLHTKQDEFTLRRLSAQMKDEKVWKILEIEPTSDEEAIRTAYRAKLVNTNPEDDQEGFMKLKEAYDTALELAKKEGILAGSSSGAALAAALKLAQTIEKGNIVTVFPDRGDRYLSKGLFD